MLSLSAICRKDVERVYCFFNGEEIIKKYDLIILNKTCVSFDSNFNDLMDICIDLVDYGVNIRYPYHIEISDEDVKLAITNAEKLVNFINNAISKDNSK